MALVGIVLLLGRAGWIVLADSRCSAEHATVDHLRSQIAALEQQLHARDVQLYFRDVRSYRLAGNVCNDMNDKEIPAISSEVAFKCLVRCDRMPGLL